jgi:hypothetical protein
MSNKSRFRKEGDASESHPEKYDESGNEGAQASHEQGCHIPGGKFDECHVGSPSHGNRNQNDHRLPAELGAIHFDDPIRWPMRISRLPALG